MIKRLLFAVALLAFTAPALADPPTPLLWKATAGEGTVYMLGSFHLLKADDYPLADSVESAYAEATRVVFEITPEDMASPELARQFAEVGLLPKGQKLSERVQPDTRAMLVSFLGSEAALPAADPYKPWFFGLGVALTAMQAAGFDVTLGLDQHFMDRVAEDGKDSGGLETIEEQLQALDGAPWEEQETSLRESLKPMPELRAEIDRLHTAWRTGDADTLDSLMVDEMAQTTPVTARMINLDRNQRWVPQVREMLDGGGTTLVVVGALHLVGEDGVPALLAAEGVDVERVGVD